MLLLVFERYRALFRFYLFFGGRPFCNACRKEGIEAFREMEGIEGYTQMVKGHILDFLNSLGDDELARQGIVLDKVYLPADV